MNLTEQHLQALQTAAASVDYGSVTLAISGDIVDIVIEKRIRLPKEPAQTPAQPLLAKK